MSRIQFYFIPDIGNNFYYFGGNHLLFQNTYFYNKFLAKACFQVLHSEYFDLKTDLRGRVKDFHNSSPLPRLNIYHLKPYFIRHCRSTIQFSITITKAR